MKIPVDIALEKAAWWTKTLDFYSVGLDNDTGDKHTVLYKKEDLDAYDPRLWEVLEELRNRQTSGATAISGEKLRLSIDYWQGNAMVVTCERDKTYFAKECAGFVFDPTTTRARLMLLTYVVLQTNNGTPYVIDTLWAQPYVTENWLDEQYPGWKKRWVVSEALNFETPTAAMNFILSGISESPTTTLGNIDLV